jgi:dihydrolipoamide dehydrogenase
MDKFDLIVIGGGPGGYVAAIRASQLGLKVCLIEKDKLGGVCLNWGCIPTKALLRTAEIHHLIKESEEFGIKINGSIKIDFKRVIERSREVSEKLSRGVTGLMQKNKIEVIYGYANLMGEGKVSVQISASNSKSLEASNIILATGARPRILPNLPIDNKVIWDYKDAMVANQIPKRLLVVGGGAIGMEFASFYQDMGSQVTLLEIAPGLLMTEDEEIATLARKAFEKRGITFLIGKKIISAKVTGETALVEVEEEKLTFDRILSAVGVIPNTDNLGLENTKAQMTESGHLITDDHMMTHEEGLYAIGDITKPPFLAHKASHEGILAAETIAGLSGHSLTRDKIPGCIYTHPQIASLGLTEAKAREVGKEIRVGKFPLLANGKALALGDDQGLIKTIFDNQTGELLGVHMIGAEVTELISNFALVKSSELTDLDLINTVFPHPTISESLHESVLASLKRVIHL